MKSSFNFVFMNDNNVNYYNNISTGMVLQNNQHPNNMMGNIAQNQLSNDVSQEYLQFLEKRMVGVDIHQSMIEALQVQNNQNNMQNYVNAMNNGNANNLGNGLINNVNNDNYRYFVASDMGTGGGSASFFRVDITDPECKVENADDKFGKELLMDMQEYADKYTNDKALPMATLMNMEETSFGKKKGEEILIFLKNGEYMEPKSILNEVNNNQKKLNEAVKEVDQCLYK